MQLSTFLITILATVAAAAPNNSGKDKKPKPDVSNKGQQKAEISCGAGAGAYCCNNDAFDKNLVECSANVNQCNTIIVCCSNQVNGQNAGGSQTCASNFEGKKVVIV